MLSDEEYRKELARYFDSIRDKESPHRGDGDYCSAFGVCRRIDYEIEEKDS